jgi:hypothetical protein
VALVSNDVSEVTGASSFLQEPQGVTTQKTPFFIVTTVKTSNLTYFFYFPIKHINIDVFKYIIRSAQKI